MKYLLDINALIALTHTGHVHHARTLAWYRSRSREDALCTCAITELGFVRVTVQTSLQLDVKAARAALAAFKRSSFVPVELLADDLGADELPAFVRTPGKLTDGHLLQLARKHDAELATLDTGIPGAAVVP